MRKAIQTTAPPGHDAAEAITRKQSLASHPGDARSNWEKWNEFLDELELLKRLPISRRTFYTWRRKGRIPSIVVGRRVLYCWKNVSEALCRMERGGGE